MFWIVLQVMVMLGFPYLSYQLQKWPGWPEWLSPVVLCYAIGIAISNLSILPVHTGIAVQTSEVSILLALPLFLFSTNFKAVRRQAKTVLLSFMLCVLSGILLNTIASFYFRSEIPESWNIAGMLTGIYTGGTPNMQAIGLALGVDQNTIILVNAADVILGSVFLLFLITAGVRLTGKWLRPYPREKEDEAEIVADDLLRNPVSPFVKVMGVLLSVLVVALSLGIVWLISGQLDQVALIILGVTSISLLFSFSAQVRQLPGTYASGEYLLLIFCVALGLLADFRAIMDGGLELLKFSAFTLFGTALLHALSARFFRIDRDTFLFTLTTALYGPAFIGQIAAVTGNRSLIFAGISMGLLGYAIGNYLGISMAYLLEWWMVG
ncbi:DUF819 family protein [Flavilitoribacter nigricans]|uniref:DUF819 family protein n=1 Tax=Flavilitoribacter nigricans (strain ATCC 23147 / DSM 23189 / NBRC 102662 / NCIMB 1420 / SS-2) TaxID=1122177 RepID=A0A2D0NF11_FLAN2|nr:DUF819 family protein [Flavilitoribacter nigricans]PHN06373.1 hypothetical protein CRP01_12450 [Flavilitoribacter nigricans DSM 23189 = NBRC 102662]